MKFLQALRQFRISSILDILWPPEDFWWPTDLDHKDATTPRQAPGLLDKPVPTPVPTLTVLEVEAAADVVGRLSELHDDTDCADCDHVVWSAAEFEHVAWSAAEMRAAAREMQQ